MIAVIGFWFVFWPYFNGAGVEPAKYDVSLNDPIATIPHEIVQQYAEFANNHVNWVLATQNKFPSDSSAYAFYEGWWREADWRRDAWLYLVVATNSEYDQETRLERLRQLRELIGWHDYYEGRMPFCVPLNRFSFVE